MASEKKREKAPRPGGGWILTRTRPPPNDGGDALYDYRHKRSRATACFSVETLFTDGKPRKHLSLRGHSEAATPVYLKQFGLSENASVGFAGMGKATHFYDPPLPKGNEEPSFIKQAKEVIGSFVKNLYKRGPGDCPP